MKTRKIALVVLEHSQWPMVKLVAGNIVAARRSGGAWQLCGSRRTVQGVSLPGVSGWVSLATRQFSFFMFRHER
jgi:hypothetical protein